MRGNTDQKKLRIWAVFTQCTSCVAMEKEALYVGYFKRHGSSHTRRIKRHACFDKETNEN